MDLNWILIWICALSSGVNLVLAFQSRQVATRGWRAVLLAILLLLSGLCLTVPDLAGYVVGPIWFVFALLPSLLLKRVNRLMAERKHRRAFWVARLAGWLHPFDGWPQQARLVRALSLYERGDLQGAAQIIRSLGDVDTSLGRTARLIEAQQTGDWRGLLEWVDQHSSSQIAGDETLLIARLQALGELGRPAEMLATLRDAWRHTVVLPPLGRAIMQLRVAALSGQVAATDRQLQTLVQTYAPEVRMYWRLTAGQVTGDAEAVQGFEQLQSTASGYLQPMIARRIATPLPRFDTDSASDDVKTTLRILLDQIYRDAQQSAWRNGPPVKPWATWGIAAVLVLSFLRELKGSRVDPSFTWNYATSLLGQTVDPENLIGLGALIVPQSFTPGEWWRVLTAGFLHFGPLHLALNLLGLLALAPRLERAWGRLPVIVCYLTATFASMSLAPRIMDLSDGPPFRVLVGASGGMMGLLGGLVGLLLVGWWRNRTDHLRKPLLFLLLIVALQTTFDLLTPNVSFACHFLGLLTGVAFGTVWTWRCVPRVVW